MADEQQMATAEAAADAVVEPVWHTTETAQTETVTGLGQAAFSIVVRSDSLDDDEPAIGVSLPAVPPRKSALHVFGEAQTFPNVYGTAQTTRTDVKSVGTGRRFTIIIGKALMPGATVSTRAGLFRVQRVLSNATRVEMVKLTGEQMTEAQTVTAMGVKQLVRALAEETVAAGLAAAREAVTRALSGGSSAAGGARTAAPHPCTLVFKLTGDEWAPLWRGVEAPATAAGFMDATTPLWLLAHVCAGIWSEAEPAKAEIDDAGAALTEERAMAIALDLLSLATVAWPGGEEQVASAAAQAGPVAAGTPQREAFAARLRGKRALVLSGERPATAARRSQRGGRGRYAAGAGSSTGCPS